MLTTEIIPRDEQGLHGRVVAQALAVPVGQPREWHRKFSTLREKTTTFHQKRANARVNEL